MSKLEKAMALKVGETMEWHDAPMCSTMIREYLNADAVRFVVGYEVTNWEASQGHHRITRVAPMTSCLLFPELAPLPGFAFPQPLSEKYRPNLIADFAGLAETKRTLAGFVSNPRAIGLLFCGPAGTGKTSMAMAVARELHGFIHHVPAGQCTVDKVKELAFSCHYFPPSGFDWNVIIIDEMDLASLPAQNAILSYLDGTNTIPQTIWVFTCNSTERLADRFLSRNRVLSFSTYGIQSDATALMQRVWEAETDAPAPNMARLIKEQQGNIRAALSILDSKLDALRARRRKHNAP